MPGRRDVGLAFNKCLQLAYAGILNPVKFTGGTAFATLNALPAQDPFFLDGCDSGRIPSRLHCGEASLLR